MGKKQTACVRLDPQQRLCPMFDSWGMQLFSDPTKEPPEKRVLDNCPEEHIQ